MPELPDLLYIKKYLIREIQGKTIASAEVKKPVVLRVAIDQPFERLVSDHTIDAVDTRGPFIRFELSGAVDLIMNLMVAGRLQHQRQGDKAEGHLCCSLVLQDGSRLNLCDSETMAKLYAVPHGEYASIPKYRQQGIDILSPAFTLEALTALLRLNARRQVRVLVNDQTILSAIGNAYADEILFEAQIHPKTFINKLPDEAIGRLHSSILSVMQWGIRMVEEAGQPIHVKVRGHMKVRNRKGEPCPRCGGTIRREGVRGYDVFFCPTCQPPSRKLFIDWSRADAGHTPPGS